jgi:lipopolysaccharide transport system permease protein
MATSSPETDPHARKATTPSSLVISLWQHRQLILQMTKREVIGRYRGSAMGLAWSFFNPVFMLVIYTFVFSTIFKSRWGTGEEQSNSQFALVLFVGLIAHGFLAEVLNRAPTLILSNSNFVKKVIFPIEILPIIAIGGAAFHSAISLFVLFASLAFFNGFLQWTVLLSPLVFLPLLLITLGLSWILASLGVFLRDISQTVAIVVSVMFFLAPVIYPLTAVPESWRPWLVLNPLTFIIEQARDLIIWGKYPDWSGLAVYWLVAICISWIGYAWFQMTRKGFADVL